MTHGNERMEGDGSSELSCLVFESWLFYFLTFRSWKELKWRHDKMIPFFHTCRHLEIKSDVYGIWEALSKCSFPSKDGSVGSEAGYACCPVLFSGAQLRATLTIQWPWLKLWLYSNQSGEGITEPATRWKLRKQTCWGLNSAYGTLVHISSRSLFFKHGDKAKWSNCQNRSKNLKRNNSAICIVTFFLLQPVILQRFMPFSLLKAWFLSLLS